MSSHDQTIRSQGKTCWYVVILLDLLLKQKLCWQLKEQHLHVFLCLFLLGCVISRDFLLHQS